MLELLPGALAETVLRKGNRGIPNREIFALLTFPDVPGKLIPCKFISGPSFP